MSGILKLFAAHPQAEPWSVDVKRIEKQIGDMLLECGERLQRAQPGMVEASALERVNTKLELIAGELVRLSMKQEQSGRRTTKANASRRPKLRVLPSVTT
jgi:hypothetical protein